MVFVPEKAEFNLTLEKFRHQLEHPLKKKYPKKN